MQFSIEFEYMPIRSCTVPLPSAAVNPSVQSTPQVIRNLEPVKGAVNSVVLEAGHLLLGMTVGLGVLVDEGDVMLDVLEAVGSDEDELVTICCDELLEARTPPTAPPTTANTSTIARASDSQKVVTRRPRTRFSDFQCRSASTVRTGV